MRRLIEGKSRSTTGIKNLQFELNYLKIFTGLVL